MPFSFLAVDYLTAQAALRIRPRGLVSPGASSINSWRMAVNDAGIPGCISRPAASEEAKWIGSAIAVSRAASPAAHRDGRGVRGETRG